MALAPKVFDNIIAVISVDGAVCTKVFRKPEHAAMYLAEKKGLTYGGSLGISPSILSADDTTMEITMQGATLDTLDWVLTYGDDAVMRKKVLFEVTKCVRNHLQRMHSDNVYHGDIKPENIVVDFDEADPYRITGVRFIDFATSSFLEEGSRYRKVHVNSVSFSTFESKQSVFRSSKRDDLWGLYATIFVFVTRGPLFCGRTEDLKTDLWQEKFSNWFYYDDSSFWTDLVLHQFVDIYTCRQFQRVFTHLKQNRSHEDVGPLPTDEELMLLFYA